MHFYVSWPFLHSLSVASPIFLGGMKVEAREKDVIKGAHLWGTGHYIIRVSFEWQGRRARGGGKNDLR